MPPTRTGRGSGSGAPARRCALGRPSQAALTWIRAHVGELGLTSEAAVALMNTTDLHIHFPEGGTPKDGALDTSLALRLLAAFCPVPLLA